MHETAPLRWGRVGDRVGMGAALTLAGAVAVAGATVYVPWLAVLGTLAHLAGWAVLPTSGARRVVAAIVSTTAVWTVLVGPRACVALVLCSACWMLARRRSARAWLAILLPLAAGLEIALLLPADMRGMLPAIGIMTAAVVGSAWIAALSDRAGRSRGGLPADHQASHPADS